MCAFVHSFIHSYSQQAFKKKLASAILELAPLLTEKMGAFTRKPCLCVQYGELLDFNSGLSSVARLIAFSNFVLHKTRLISNQQTVFPGCSEIIADILERPNREWANGYHIQS